MPLLDLQPISDQGALAPSSPTREQIERLEAQMRLMEQLPIEPVHHFADGLYAREILIRAGTILTGKVHSTEHLNIVSKGRIVVWTEDGMKEVSAPCTMVSRPGTKRVGFALEDTVWTTIHANPQNLTDLAALEVALIDNTQPAITSESTPCLG
jgi:hypothetical protein